MAATRAVFVMSGGLHLGSKSQVKRKWRISWKIGSEELYEMGRFELIWRFEDVRKGSNNNM